MLHWKLGMASLLKPASKEDDLISKVVKAWYLHESAERILYYFGLVLDTFGIHALVVSEDLRTMSFNLFWSFFLLIFLRLCLHVLSLGLLSHSLLIRCFDFDFCWLVILLSVDCDNVLGL